MQAVNFIKNAEDGRLESCSVITNHGIAIWDYTEIVLGQIGNCTLCVASDATRDEYCPEDFIFYLQSNSDPIYLGFITEFEGVTHIQYDGNTSYLDEDELEIVDAMLKEHFGLT